MVDRRPGQHGRPAPVGGADPGTVLVGEATHRAAPRARSRSRPPASTTLKGKARRCQPGGRCAWWRERGGTRPPDALEPPFVGRTEELRLLKELFHATGRERQGRASSRSSGRAGSARAASRGSWRSTSTASWRPSGGTTAAAPSYGEGVTFWALGEMVRRRAGLAEGDDAETTRARSSPRWSREHVAGRGGAALDRAAAARACSASASARRRPRGAVRRVANVLRAARRGRAPSRWCSRTCSGPMTGLLDFIESTCSSGRRDAARSSS